MLHVCMPLIVRIIWVATTALAKSVGRGSTVTSPRGNVRAAPAKTGPLAYTWAIIFLVNVHRVLQENYAK